MNDLILVARFIISCIFIYAGLRKITDLESFNQSIQSFNLIPSMWSKLLSYILPIFEILMGMLVLIGIGVLIGALSILFMLIIFSSALTVAHLRNQKVNCGCFGTDENSNSYWRTLVRNATLVLLACITAFGGIHQPFLWQILISQGILTLVASFGIVAAFRLGGIIWDILHIEVHL